MVVRNASSLCQTRLTVFLFEFVTSYVTFHALGNYAGEWSAWKSKPAGSSRSVQIAFSLAIHERIRGESRFVRTVCTCRSWTQRTVKERDEKENVWQSLIAINGIPYLHFRRPFSIGWPLTSRDPTTPPMPLLSFSFSFTTLPWHRTLPRKNPARNSNASIS